MYCSEAPSAVFYLLSDGKTATNCFLKIPYISCGESRICYGPDIFRAIAFLWYFNLKIALKLRRRNDKLFRRDFFYFHRYVLLCYAQTSKDL